MADQIVRTSIVRFTPDELPVTYGGLSVYRNVVICWDDDRDPRVLDFVDGLDNWDRAELIAAHESKGTLELVWKSRIPQQYAENECVDVANDSWSINVSRRAIDPFDQPEICQVRKVSSDPFDIPYANRTDTGRAG